jgi:lysophospholipase L1-like esterase
MRIVRVVLALVVFCLGLELFARVDDRLTYGAPLTGRYDNEILYVRDSLGRRGKPFARFRKWSLNEAGFRGPALQAGRATVVTFGASETFGLYEGEGQEYPRQLERLLNERLGGDVVQVVNAAYPGQSAATATLRLPEIAERLRPSVAIIYATPADYIWLPYLERRAPEKTAPDSAAAAKGEHENIPPVRTAPDVGPRFQWRMIERLTTLAKAVIPRAVQSRLREREIEAATANVPVMKRLPEENVQRFHDDVTKLVEAARAAGVQPVVVTHASAIGASETAADRDLLVSWRKFYPMLEEDGFPDMERRMNDALRRVAAEQHVTLIDAARAIPADRRYFADFVHFSNAGAALMARTLADGLEPLLRAQLDSTGRTAGAGRATAAFVHPADSLPQLTR